MSWECFNDDYRSVLWALSVRSTDVIVCTLEAISSDSRRQGSRPQGLLEPKPKNKSDCLTRGPARITVRAQATTSDKAIALLLTLKTLLELTHGKARVSQSFQTVDHGVHLFSKCLRQTQRD
jgi:hypothetical protein